MANKGHRKKFSRLGDKSLLKIVYIKAYKIEAI